MTRRHGVLLLACGLTSDAFAPPNQSNIPHGIATSSYTSSSSSSTAVNAFPPLIIGPMIQKMRSEKQKASMPLADADESKNEAPGLRVGERAWKWPPVWPYDANFFKRKSELDAANMAASPLSMMTGGGVGGGLATDVDGEGTTASTASAAFDSLGYWEKVKDVRTDLDERVAEKIRL